MFTILLTGNRAIKYHSLATLPCATYLLGIFTFTGIKTGLSHASESRLRHVSPIKRD